ncbi:hypothetical protein A7Q10_03340 [Methylacidiphilum caldifontis]|uniref:Uncharacterized protein n=1 Tax=Methylacidiphilum caldifontis TaxID=2795386 RepID=A0A4Y8PII8_9BACT|nr:hypothetical protein A7Q10_03340 [Methylacidiphilum caldifontis]
MAIFLLCSERPKIIWGIERKETANGSSRHALREIIVSLRIKIPWPKERKNFLDGIQFQNRPLNLLHSK